jgi:hypothetical protein
VGHGPRIDVAGHAVGIVGQRHRGAADNEYAGDDTSSGQALAQGSEGTFKFRPAKEDIISITHAASRS